MTFAIPLLIPTLLAVWAFVGLLVNRANVWRWFLATAVFALVAEFLLLPYLPGQSGVLLIFKEALLLFGLVVCAYWWAVEQHAEKGKMGSLLILWLLQLILLLSLGGRTNLRNVLLTGVGLELLLCSAWIIWEQRRGCRILAFRACIVTALGIGLVVSGIVVGYAVDPSVLPNASMQGLPVGQTTSLSLDLIALGAVVLMGFWPLGIFRSPVVFLHRHALPLYTLLVQSRLLWLYVLLYLTVRQDLSVIVLTLFGLMGVGGGTYYGLSWRRTIGRLFSALDGLILGFFLLCLAVGGGIEAASVMFVLDMLAIQMMLLVLAVRGVPWNGNADIVTLAGSNRAVSIPNIAFLMAGLTLIGWPLGTLFWMKLQLVGGVLLEVAPLLILVGGVTSVLLGLHIFRMFFYTQRPFARSEVARSSHGWAAYGCYFLFLFLTIFLLFHPTMVLPPLQQIHTLLRGY